MIDTEAIKQNNSLPGIYENLTGNCLRRSGDKLTGLCPFHNDSRSGNFFIYPDNTFHCFACNEDGDIIAFVQKALNKTFEEACIYIDSNIQVRSKQPIKKTFLEKPEIISDKTKEIYRYFFAILSLTEEGLNYLKGRGLKESIILELQIKSIKDPEAISQKLKQNFSIEELTASGLFGIGKNDKPYFAFYIPCLIFTAFEKNEPVYFCSRNFDQNKRFFKLHNRKQDYFKGDLTKDKIYIFEAIIDAISFYQVTGRNNFIILSGLNYRLYQNIVAAYPGRNIIVAFDNDIAGKKAENDIYIHCGNRPECFDYTAFKNTYGIRTSNYKDINDLLQIYELLKKNQAVIKAMIEKLSYIDKERFEERAAIMEFDSGMIRPEAERNALLNIFNEL